MHWAIDVVAAIFIAAVLASLLDSFGDLVAYLRRVVK